MCRIEKADGEERRKRRTSCTLLYVPAGSCWKDFNSHTTQRMVVTKKGEHRMHFKRIFIVLIGIILAVGIFGCAKEQKTETPKQEQISKDLVPPKAEVKSQNFLVELTDLKVDMTVDTASKEITETPNLKGNIKVTNTSKDVLDIQAVTLEYLDEGGKPIPFSSGDKIANVSPFWKALNPGEAADGSLYNVTTPRKAIKEKALGKIQVNLVYVTKPLNRETLTVPEKVE